MMYYLVPPFHSYTFGQPVKGNLSFTVHNQQGRKCRKEVTYNVTVSTVCTLSRVIMVCLHAE